MHKSIQAWIFIELHTIRQPSWYRRQVSSAWTCLRENGLLIRTNDMAQLLALGRTANEMQLIFDAKSCVELASIRTTVFDQPPYALRRGGHGDVGNAPGREGIDDGIDDGGGRPHISRLASALDSQ